MLTYWCKNFKHKRILDKGSYFDNPLFHCDAFSKLCLILLREESRYFRLTVSCGQRPMTLVMTASSDINLSKRSGVKDWGPSDSAFAGLG